MNYTSIAFLGVAGLLFVVGIIVLFSGDGSKSKKEKKNVESFDDDYPALFKENFLKSLDISETLQYLESHYEENPYMSGLIENALTYLEGDYGDYETALSLINVHDDEEVSQIHKDAIKMVISNRTGLPGA